MAILIDPPLWPAHGTLWSHLVSDTSADELHAFARSLRLPRRSFDLDHYDVPASRHAAAVALGAHAVGSRDVVHRLRASGLRVRQAERAAARPVFRRRYLDAEWAGLGAVLETAIARTPGGSARPRSGHASGRFDRSGWLDLGDALIARWNEPHRSYHDERHLEDVLLALDHLTMRGERPGTATLLAAWFHDAVYTGAAGDDERASAEFAVHALSAAGVDRSLAQQVGALVLATVPTGSAEAAGSKGSAGSTASTAPHAAHLLDADLAIFAAPVARYDEYARAVRGEYAHIAEASFVAGRSQILSAYLARPTIYRTATARDLWEARARANVGREIEGLAAFTRPAGAPSATR